MISGLIIQPEIHKKINKLPLFFIFQLIFTESLIGHFLTVLMQVLMHKSHDLLKEEITLAIYHMARF